MNVTPLNESFRAGINDLKIQLAKLAVIGHNETAGECICPNISLPVTAVKKADFNKSLFGHTSRCPSQNLE